MTPVNYRRSVDDAWRRLRSLRANPPEHAGRGSRKALFVAALEQSEQFFRAADNVGYETKPVLLYYGLNQASRAILAAKRNPKIQGAPSSHGIKTPNLGQDPAVGDLEVENDGASGSFSQLATVLESPTLPGRVPLRELWFTLPEGVAQRPTGVRALIGAVRFERTDGQPIFRHFDATTARVGKLHHTPLRFAPADVGDIERELHERFPALVNFHPMPSRTYPEMARVTMLLSDEGPPESVALNLSFDPNGRGLSHLDNFGMLHMSPSYAYIYSADRSVWLPPTLPGNPIPLHPLVTWWAALFALSMLARYQPTNWARSIAINSSPDATALEHLMDRAHVACANLIAELFDGHSGPGQDLGDEIMTRQYREFERQRESFDAEGGFMVISDPPSDPE